MWNAFIGLMINILLFIYNLIGNFGLAILLFTLLIRAITHPLMVRQIKGSTAMQDMQKDPRYIEMQEKYKDDKEKLVQEQQKLWKEYGVNPLSSCLPTLIQLPIIIGLYQAIIQSLGTSPLELFNLTKHVYSGFLDIAKIIPLESQFLWMNLGQPERLHIPGLSFGIPILAVVVVVTTYIQGKLMAPAPTGEKDQSAQMMNMMNLYMPFLMGYLAYYYASGLALYFVASNLLSIGQYALLGKLNWSNLIPGRKPAVVTASPSTGARSGGSSSSAPAKKPVKKSNPDISVTSDRQLRSPKPKKK